MEMKKLTWKFVVEETVLRLQHSLINNSKVSKLYFDMISVLFQPDHLKTVQKKRNELCRCANILCGERMIESLQRRRMFCSNSCRIKSEHMEKSLDLLSPYRRFNLSVTEVVLFASKLCEFGQLTEESLTKLYHEELNRNQIMKHDIVLEEKPEQPPMDISSFYGPTSSKYFPQPAETVIELPEEMRFFGIVWVNLSRWVTNKTNIFMTSGGGKSSSPPSPPSDEKQKEKLKSSFSKSIHEVTKKHFSSNLKEEGKATKVHNILVELVDTLHLDDDHIFKDFGNKHYDLVVLVMIMACLKQKMFSFIFEAENEKEKEEEKMFLALLETCEKDYRLVEFRVSFILNLLINGT